MHEKTPEYRAEVRKETDEAVQRSFDNAATDFKEWAFGCIVSVAKRKREFTINDVRDVIHAGEFKTHDNRAIGGVMRSAVSKGIMKASGRTLPNKVGHGTHMQIWESLVYTE